MPVKYVHDMTEGNEVSHIIKFTWLMLIGIVFQQFYNLIDSMNKTTFLRSFFIEFHDEILNTIERLME